MSGEQVRDSALQVEALVCELKTQFLCTLDMLEAAVRACPEELWTKLGASAPFWHEAFHCVFWIRNFVGDCDKQFETVPFGKDIDPHLFSPPNNTCSREEALGFIEAAHRHVAGTFDTMTPTDFVHSDDGFGEFRSVYHRLLYALRHGQHHVGKLYGMLAAHGVEGLPWKG